MRTREREKESERERKREGSVSVAMHKGFRSSAPVRGERDSKND